MKLLRTTLFSILILVLTVQVAQGQCGNLYIEGVIDGPLSGGTPKAMRLCATADISDLSIYGIESVNNGGGSSGNPEYNFPADALTSGDCIWIASETIQFNAWFGFDPCYSNSVMQVNGDDALLLYCSGTLEDVFGDPNMDGTGEPWEYADGWASASDAAADPVFDELDWTYSGPDALDGETDNASASTPYPNPSSNCPVSLPDISINDISQNEGDAGTSLFSFTVTLSAIDAADVTFDINTADGSATVADMDYVSIVGGMGTITAGNLTTTIDVTVNGDTDIESDETFDVVLSNISANATISDGTGTGTILNDDSPMVSCPNIGDIIITEIMQNPEAVGDGFGEYIEVYNTTGSAIDIDGWEITDDGIDSHIISNGGPLNVPPGSYLVLGINEDDMTNGGITVDYEYTSFNLGNSDDEVVLNCDPLGTTVEVDRVDYDGGTNFPDPSGASMNLDPGNFNSVDNDNGANWCESTSMISGGDLGTPGTMNDVCGAVLPSISISDVSQNEGDAGTSLFTFTVTLSAMDAADVTFDINTADGSATIADMDYVAIVGGMGTITAGNLNTTIDITVNGDTDFETDETFDVILSNISANATISDGTGTGTILNDDMSLITCPNVGDIIITEIMQNPDAVGDGVGEYFEIYNTTANPIDIDGWEIADNTADSHIISNGGPLNVPANGYLVLGINDDDLTNGGVIVDYAYTGINLSNSDDEIILNCDPTGSTVEVDRVDYDGGPNFPDPTGASMNLDPGNFNSSDNDNGANWCESTSMLSGGDLGTPGAMNDVCSNLPDISINDVSMLEGDSGTSTFSFTVTLSAMDAADVTFDINTADGTATTADMDYTAIISGMGTITAGNLSTTIDVTVNGDTNVEANETFDVVLSNISANATISDGTGTGTIENDDNNCPNVGDIIITEIMQNPDAVLDDNGEYFEIYNTTGNPIDIDGWEIADDGSDSHIISNGGPLNVPAGGYLVLSNNMDNLTNGGITVDYEYTSYTLSNSDDEVVLNCDPTGSTVEVDRVDYDGGTNFPDPSGASMNLDPGSFNSSDNDTGANWCVSTSMISGGDLGTPGTMNDACGASLPSISINDVSMVEGNAGTGTFSFTVTLSAMAGADVTFDINTMDGTATVADMDYVEIVGGMGTITAGNLNTTVDVTVNGDTTIEPDETFDVVLSNISANATINDGTGTGTIEDDDNNCPSMLNLSGTITMNQIYETSGSIISGQIIEAPADVEYNAATEIILNYPFHVKVGAEFEAYIDGCGN